MNSDIASFDLSGLKVAIVENTGADFVISRLRLARYLRDRGAEIMVIVPADGSSDEIRDAGFQTLEVSSNIRGKGIGNKLRFMRDLRKICRNNRFDIIHFYRMQPNLIGTPVASLTSKPKIVNHITGLGVVYSSRTWKNRLLQFAITSAYRLNGLLFSPHYILQNTQDVKDLKIKKRYSVIRGSAVDEDRFNLKNVQTLENHSDGLTFLFVSRLLKEKGVLELVESFIAAQSELPDGSKLQLVGWSDPQNPSAISEQWLKDYTRAYPGIKVLGKRSDIPELIKQADVCVLPTRYREGTPRFMLESMAMAKPIITTNMPGCDHLIPKGKNGILVEPNDQPALTAALLCISSLDLNAMGQAGYSLYFNEFSEKVVYSSIADVYLSMTRGSQ
ncbi:glycosyltransferase family 4 protein [Aureitalea marina]|uniref:Glycosyltransferase subfamily 4-like N-terminal domain-containing protein n=1 Tax=Aureitalea marina TaxID=930804 RepID=A0A2S7KNP5_9FLAO|nr:glycosyltransferase family 4 protein [Aureitalea marina]PQB04249.1 hypothetical protein BST85_04520 [Aureitalea marina]